MKYLIRSIITDYCYLQGFFKKKREGIVVLMYHRVNDTLPANDLSVPVAKFREQMEYLRKNCEVVGISALICEGRKTKDEGRKKQKVVITFDDGYMDNYVNAYPVLKELGLPATIFLVTGMIGTDKKRPRYNHMPSPDMLSWAKVMEMAQNGIAFGAHTVDHPHLSELSYQGQKEEIGKSMAVLDGMLETRNSKLVTCNRIFCYPYGDYNGDTLKIMQELDVKAAFTVKPGINEERRLKGEGRWELRRTEISGVDSLFDFKKKLAGAFDWLHTMIQKKKVSACAG
jgi:peptidoglycan/xylan/chitin deacetylase (PgdA/CDA1 family)